MNLSVLDKYDFLKIPERINDEEYAVTNEAIDYYWNHFAIYTRENDWEKHECQPRRHQMTKPGGWLQKKSITNTVGSEKNLQIDIAGDILTSTSAFTGCDKKIPDLPELFVRVYHTIGNCIPWPEGGNLGGRPFKAGGGPDNFYPKLLRCKGIFENDPYYECDIEPVTELIRSGKTLGVGKNRINYWLNEVWISEGKSWKDFVKINHLQDMVDKDYDPRPFVVGGERIDLENQKQIRETYLQSIKMIICRGYRIAHDGKLNEDVINSIFEELGLSDF